MNNIIQWPIQLDHGHDHKRLHNNLVEIICDYNDYIKTNDKDIKVKRLSSSNDIDLSEISIQDLLIWIIDQACSTNHIHKDI